MLSGWWARRLFGRQEWARATNTRQAGSRKGAPQRCLLKSSRLMQALQDMQWKESTPRPRPCGRRGEGGACMANKACVTASGGVGLPRAATAAATLGTACAHAPTRAHAQRGAWKMSGNPVHGQLVRNNQVHGANHPCTRQEACGPAPTWRQKLQKGQW